MVRTGSVGVALRLVNAEFSESGGAAAPFAFGGMDDPSEVGIASVVGAFRFVVEEVTRTLPFPAALRGLRWPSAAFCGL